MKQSRYEVIHQEREPAYIRLADAGWHRISFAALVDREGRQPIRAMEQINQKSHINEKAVFSTQSHCQAE